MTTVTNHYRIPAELRDRLKQEAEKRVVSVNLLVTNAIGFYLAHLPPVPDAYDDYAAEIASCQDNQEVQP